MAAGLLLLLLLLLRFLWRRRRCCWRSRFGLHNFNEQQGGEADVNSVHQAAAAAAPSVSSAGCAPARSVGMHTRPSVGLPWLPGQQGLLA